MVSLGKVFYAVCLTFLGISRIPPGTLLLRCLLSKMDSKLAEHGGSKDERGGYLQRAAKRKLGAREGQQESVLAQFLVTFITTYTVPLKIDSTFRWSLV